MATSDKYDRQLRLWGASGQRALAETCVVLVRATAAGTETLKNLVLPGVGSILVVDDALAVSAQDVAHNFFTPQSDVGKPRAQVACQQLLELNPDVHGQFETVASLQTCVSSVQAWQDILRERTSGKSRILVVASDLEPPVLEALARTCHELKQCLIAVHSYGLVGVVRLQTPALPVLNPKPRDAPADLRLTCPFPSLQQMAQQIAWNTLDMKAHKHVPYPLLLVRIASEYKASHDGKLPKTLAEKQEFQALIKAAALDYHEEENFIQAVQNAYLAYAGRPLDIDHVQNLLSQSSEHADLKQFTVLLQALLEFAAQHEGQAPLQGTIPDMTASTDLYVQLQTIYKQQAAVEFQEMKQLVEKHGSATQVVDEETLVTFCQNAHHLDLVTCRSIHDEIYGTISDEISEDLVMALDEEEDEAKRDMVPLLWYLGFQACQAFYRDKGRYPGTTTSDYLLDVAPLQKQLELACSRYKLPNMSTFYQPAATELARYGNAELHTIAALVGGVASQEAVKLITGQYTPIQHVYVYNGIASTGGVYKV